MTPGSAGNHATLASAETDMVAARLLRPSALLGALGMTGAMLVLASCEGSHAGVSTTEPSTAQPKLAESADVPPQLQFGLESEHDGYAVDATELTGRGGQAIGVNVLRDNQPFREFVPYHDQALHVFLVGHDIDYLTHEVVTEAGLPTVTWPLWVSGNTGESRVVVAFNTDDGPFILGHDVTVVEPSDFDVGHRRADGRVFVDAEIALTRDDFDFTLDEPWTGPLTYGAPAWLSMVRQGDLALSFDTADLVGDRTFRFDPDLPGPGRYLALVELWPNQQGTRTIEFSIDVSDHD